MNALKGSEISFYLEKLKDTTVFPEVQNAVARKDLALFSKICKKVKIPKEYIGILKTIVFSVEPDQDPWP